jgi:very-short-patch-repair endonuclease
MMRDREIIQPKVLQGLGWTIVRVWQEDYFRHPEATIRQIVDKIK